jgi:hypothetical protein
VTSLVMAVISCQLFVLCQRPSSWFHSKRERPNTVLTALRQRAFCLWKTLAKYLHFAFSGFCYMKLWSLFVEEILSNIFLRNYWFGQCH